VAERRAVVWLFAKESRQIKEKTMPVIDKKAASELHQIQVELSILRRAFCAYVEAKGVKIPGYDEPLREAVAPSRRRRARSAKRAK
jgi:hypothetical protein